MKLKLNNGSDNKEIQNNNIYEQARKELEKDFIQDMVDSSIDVEMDEESINRANKKYKQLLIKKNILYVSIIATFSLVIIFGFYKTFFEHKYTGQEIAFLSNKFNGKTNFPESGVQGYLESNIDKLLKEKLGIDSKVTEMSLGKPVVTRINAKNNNLSNVYFYITIKSNIGENTVNCILPIYWDSDIQEYSPAGSIMLTPNKPSNENTNEVKNTLLSFEGISQESDEALNSSKTFVNNFFTMLYAGQDVTPYYKGDATLDVEGLNYESMTEYMLYKDTNGNGYNATAKINLKMPNGISYQTQKYLTIKKSGESWIVEAVL